MNSSTFPYHLTKYFADYLPNQLAASVNTIRSYRDTFVQMMEFYQKAYRIPPERLDYSSFSAQRTEEFLAWLEKERGIGTSTRNQRLAAIHAFSDICSTVTLRASASVQRCCLYHSKRSRLEP